MYPAEKLADFIPLTEVEAANEQRAIAQRQQLFPSSDWLSKHPIMSEVRELPTAFFAPLKALQPQICESLDPMLCQGLTQTSRQGREWHYGFSRNHIREAIRNGQVLYTVANVGGLYGGYPYGDGREPPKPLKARSVSGQRLIKTGHSNEKEITNAHWFPHLNRLPESLIVFSSRADAIAYSAWAEPGNFPVIVSFVSMGQLPRCELSRVEICYNGNNAEPPAVLCTRMDRKQAVILGLEILTYPGQSIVEGAIHGVNFMTIAENPKLMGNVLCETPFDALTPQLLKSKPKLRMQWHHQFVSNLEDSENPTLTDLCNWITGYCSYYQEHKGEEGRLKAGAIRDLMQQVSVSLRPWDQNGSLVDPSLEDFLNHRPGGAQSPSLHDLINGRRDKKAGKNSWGWEQIQKTFLEDKTQPRHRWGCGR